MKTPEQKIVAVEAVLAAWQAKVNEPIDTFGDSVNADDSAERAQKERDQKFIDLFRTALGKS